MVPNKTSEMDKNENDVEIQASLTQNDTANTGNEADGDIKYRTPSGLMPRQWLIDRCDGTSKYNPESRPPCRICWVPIPVKWFPDFLEQNCCCEAMGRSGCIDPENTRVRRLLFQFAFVINVIGLLCLIVSMFAITTEHYNFLWRTEFTQIWLQLIQGPNNYTDAPVFWAVGLRAIAYDNELTNKNGMAAFGDICAMLQQGRQASLQAQRKSMDSSLLLVTSEPDFDCNNCEAISRRIVPSLFLSMLSYIPNFSTDILRIYSNYDVNCQKFLASTFSWISLATSIYTWVNYRKGCFDSLNTEPFAVNENLQKVEMTSDDVFLVVNYKWQAGLGQIFLAIATFLKIIDIVINIMVRTPTITRDYLEQVEYEWKYGAHHDCDECGVEKEEDEEDARRRRIQRDGDDSCEANSLESDQNGGDAECEVEDRTGEDGDDVEEKT